MQTRPALPHLLALVAGEEGSMGGMMMERVPRPIAAASASTVGTVGGMIHFSTRRCYLDAVM